MHSSILSPHFYSLLHVTPKETTSYEDRFKLCISMPKGYQQNCISVAWITKSACSLSSIYMLCIHSVKHLTLVSWRQHTILASGLPLQASPSVTSQPPTLHLGNSPCHYYLIPPTGIPTEPFKLMLGELKLCII